MKFNNKFLQYSYNHRYTFIYAALALTIIWFHIYMLANTPHNFHFDEVETARQALSMDILEDPVSAPYNYLLQASTALLGFNTISMRLPSVILSLIGLVFVYLLTNQWFKRRLSVITTAFVGLSAWTLHFARFTNDSSALLVLVPALMWLTVNTLKTKGLKSLIGYATVIGLGLYTPFFIWIAGASVATFLLLKWKHDIKFGIQNGLIFWALLLLLISPLLVSVVKDPELLWDVTGLVSSIFAQPLSDLLSAGLKEWFYHLFIEPDVDPAYSLVGFPRLTLMSIFFGLVGLYKTFKNFNKTQHFYVVLSLATFSIPVILTQGLLHNSFIPLIVPIYLLVALGIDEIVGYWYKVFPFNPVARSLVVIPLMLIVVLYGHYHYQRYFNAWAQAPETRSVFTIGEEDIVRFIEDEQE